MTSDTVKRGSTVGKSLTALYDGLGRVYQIKGMHNQVLTYAYDGNGNVLSVTDKLNHKTQYTYDALNRVATMTDPASGVTHYVYDKGDHVVKVTDPRGLITSYSYDGLGLLWKQVSADTGTTTFSYDSSGRLASKHRADGTTLTYSYDAVNRPTHVAAAGQSQAFTWDNCTGGKGRLCKVTDAHTTVSYTYSPEGWTTARHFAITGASSYSLGYSYDSMGHLATITYPDGNQAIYDYSRGMVKDIRLKVGGSTVTGVSGISYRPMDLAMAGWTSYGGLVNTITYDSDLRPTGIAVPNVENLSFSYDNANRITKVTNGLDSSMTQNLGYDAVGRLTSVSSGADHESYAYDADGNRKSAVINGVTWTYTMASGSNRLAHGSNSSSWSTAYQYDANGNMLGTSYSQYWTYDAFNRMRTATPSSGSPVTTYDVNPEGQRLRKYTSSTHTYFAPDRSGPLLAEYEYPDWTDYVWLNGRLVGIMKEGAIYAVHTDQTGRPEAITDASHTILWRARNWAFDRTVITATWGTFNIGFPGQYYDGEAGSWGVWHNGYRDYAASPYFGGRYLESDPIGLAGGVNTYAYVGNNPVSNIDPLGLLCFDFNKFADEIRDNRLSTVLGKLGQAVTAGNLASTLANTPFRYPRAGIGTAAGSPTSLLSRLGMRFRVRLPIRVFGTTNALRALGRFGVASTIAEGAWDLGVEIKAAADATSTGDCRCKKH